MENNQKAIEKVVTLIKDLPALKLAEDARVKNKFIDIFNLMNGKENGAIIHAMESFHFNKLLSENPKLASCSKLSLYGVFIDVAAQGLSFDPNKKLCYIIPRGHKIGIDENGRDLYEQRASLTISPYGELYLRQMYGQVIAAENPEIVYAGEKFTIENFGNGKVVKHTIEYPRPDTKIVACYFKFTKADGTIDYSVLDQKDIERLKGFSSRQNGGKANALYGTDGNIDKGFLMAKTIKHAFRAYPKVKLKGQFSQMEQEHTTEDKEFDYEMNDEVVTQISSRQDIDEDTGEIKDYTPTVISEAPKEQVELDI